MMRFSIAIPAYKTKFLQECISSILKQTYEDFELIILNDKSPNNVKEIVSKFSDSRIRYYENESNVGAINLVHTWNKCLSLARGEYFVMMGDDDLMEAGYLVEFNSLIASFPNVDVFHCRSEIIDENSSAFALTPGLPAFESVYDNVWHRLRGNRIQFISDFLYRRKTLKENGGFYYLPLAWGSDDITSYINATNTGIAHTNNTVFKYRSSRYTISSTGNYELKLKAVLEYEAWLDRFLAFVPSNSHDLILKQLIKEEVPRFIRNRKVAALENDFKKNLLSITRFFFTNKRKYKLTLNEYFLCFAKRFK